MNLLPSTYYNNLPKATNILTIKYYKPKFYMKMLSNTALSLKFHQVKHIKAPAPLRGMLGRDALLRAWAFLTHPHGLAEQAWWWRAL